MIQALKTIGKKIISSGAGTDTMMIVGGIDGAGNAVPLSGGVTGTFATGQKAIAVTGTAVNFDSNGLAQGMIIRANAGNSGDISVGTSAVNNTRDGTGNGTVLAPGESTSVAVNNSNLVYINGTTGDWASFIGS